MAAGGEGWWREFAGFGFFVEEKGFFPLLEGGGAGFACEGKEKKAAMIGEIFGYFRGCVLAGVFCFM